MRTFTVEDDLGSVSLPVGALYGAQTARTVQNMSFTGITLGQFPVYVDALLQVKQACAKANAKAGVISETHCNRIVAAITELATAQYANQFVVDMFHGGGGIGINMNVNEVVANVAGDGIHPVEHVNASQSTSDVCHSALRIALFRLVGPLIEEMSAFVDTIEALAESYQPIQTIARTCWQDGMRVPLSSLFEALASAIRRRRVSLVRTCEMMLNINLGGTVVGSGTGAPEAYRAVVVRELQQVTGLPLQLHENLYDAAQYPDDLVQLSAEVNMIASVLRKFAQDLRILSSGPEAGLAELNLPKVQAGSSFFPGKVNPVIAETMVQCSMLVAGNHHVIESALSMSEVHLCVWEPMMGTLLMQNVQMLQRALHSFHTRCVSGITPNVERCEAYAAKAKTDKH